MYDAYPEDRAQRHEAGLHRRDDVVQGRRRPFRILVVSADPVRRNGWAGVLTKHGLEPRPVSSASDALDHLTSHPVDLTLADADLPSDGALNLSKDMYSRVSGSHPILLVGQSSVIDRVVAVELGADDLLPQDVDERELVARIRAIARRVTSAGRRRRAADWRARAAVRLLEAPNGRCVALSALHWELLMLLARNEGDPIDAHRAAAAIPSFRGNPDVALRNAVSRLRRKLMDAIGTAPISNYYGSGYVLDVSLTVI